MKEGFFWKLINKNWKNKDEKFGSQIFWFAFLSGFAGASGQERGLQENLS